MSKFILDSSAFLATLETNQERISTQAKLIGHFKNIYQCCHSREGGNPGRFPPSRE